MRHLATLTTSAALSCIAVAQSSLAQPLKASSVDPLQSKNPSLILLADRYSMEVLTTMNRLTPFSFVKYYARKGEPISSFSVSCEELDPEALLQDEWADTFSVLNYMPKKYTASQIIESCEGVLGAASNGITLGAPGMPYIVDEQLRYFDMLIVDTTIHVVPEGEGGNL